MSLATLMAQTSEQPSASAILQSVLLGLLIVFVFAVVTTGFVTKKINNISEATYGKAFLATFFKNLLGWPVFMMALTLQGMPPIAAFGIAAMVVPVLVYKVVYSCMWREALAVWVVVFAVEAAVGYGLTLTGLMSLQAFGA